MKARVLAVMGVALLGLVRPASAISWADFHDDFDSLPAGTTIGVSDPSNWDDAGFVPGNAGLLIAAAPGGGQALTFNPAGTDTSSRSDRLFGALSAATEQYRFSFRAYAGGAESQAFLIYKQANINGSTFTLGLFDGAIHLAGDGLAGSSSDPLSFDVSIPTTGVWYEFEALYTQQPGLDDDTIEAIFRQEGAPSFTSLGTVFVQDHELHDAAADTNQILAFIRENGEREAANCLDDIAGAAVVTAAVPEPLTVSLGAMSVASLALAAFRRR